MKIVIKISFILSLILILSCTEKTKEDAIHEETSSSSTMVHLTVPQYNSAGIKLGRVEMREISNTIKANGMLDVPPQNMATISAVYGGFIKNTELLQGMMVKKGQVIAVMEHPDYIQLQQDYLENKSKLDLAEAEFKRQQELARENINAAKTLQQAESNFQISRAKVEGLKSKLKLISIEAKDLKNGKISNSINIYAPLSGYVTQVNVNVGSYVNPTDILFKIVDTKHLHAEIIVYEKDVSKIKIGQRVRIQLANENTERIVTVYLVGKEIGADRTIRVHGHLEKEDTQLLPGMYLSALFESGTGSVLSLPEQAIINYEGKDYVFIVRDESKRAYEMVEVNTGVNESGYSEVKLPAHEEVNTQVVIEGAYDLLGYLKNAEEGGGH